MRREEDLRQLPEDHQHLTDSGRAGKRGMKMSGYWGRNFRKCAVFKAKGRQSFRKKDMKIISNVIQRNLWLNAT